MAPYNPDICVRDYQWQCKDGNIFLDDFNVTVSCETDSVYPLEETEIEVTLAPITDCDGMDFQFGTSQIFLEAVSEEKWISTDEIYDLVIYRKGLSNDLILYESYIMEVKATSPITNSLKWLITPLAICW